MREPASSAIEPIDPVAFGSYTLVAKLAVGGMGEVFLARRPAMEGLSQLLVLKRIRVELASDPQFVSRFLAEARVLLHLQHSAITQVYDVGSVAGRSYIALELVDGKDLRALLSRMQERGERVPPGLALQVAARVLDALAYAHRKKGDDGVELNLVHRDISPQNVLVSYEGEVKVIDFGLAKSALSGQRTQPSMILGKLLYMAPEIAKHDQLDRRADLFATGVMLHELLLGKHELAEVSAAELMMRVAAPKYALLEGRVPGLPAGFDAALQKALAVDPAQRYRTAEEMRSALVPLAVAAGSDLSPEPLGELVRSAFSEIHATERQLLRQLREGGAKRPGDTFRSVELGGIQAVAPTAMFPVISETPSPNQTTGVEATYVGGAPRPDGAQARTDRTLVAQLPDRGTEPAMPQLDAAEFLLRPAGRKTTAGELELVSGGLRPGNLVELHALATKPPAPLLPRLDGATEPLGRLTGSATLPGIPPLSMPPPAPIAAATTTESTDEVPLGPLARLGEPPRQRAPQRSANPPRSRSGTAVPVAHAPVRPPTAPQPAANRLRPLLLGIGIGAAVAALLTLALVLLMRR